MTQELFQLLIIKSLLPVYILQHLIQNARHLACRESHALRVKKDNQGKYKLIAAKSFRVKFAVLLAPAAVGALLKAIFGL